MPLDGHQYLVSQGWKGRGTGLRHGAIERPVVVVQKKTLAGIGKDRDEAFPFWEHVYSAAASAIKVKLYESDSEDTDESTPAITLQRTSTGIISNRRPVTGVPAAHSGTATPSSSGASGSSTPRMSIMAAAKQEAARRSLYSMFFRGPVLGTDPVEEIQTVESQDAKTIRNSEVVAVVQTTESTIVKKEKRKTVEGLAGEEKDGSQRKRKTKKEKGSRKGKEVATADEDIERDVDATRPEDERAEKKRQRKEERRRKAAEKEAVVDTGKEQEGEGLTKEERKRLRAEKRARKEARRKRGVDEEGPHKGEDSSESAQPPSRSSNTDGDTVTKKRKRGDDEKSKKKQRL
ncbi:hypothetical protein BDW22DRAFT_1353621 [Trametopsis cervina]|nr:hypothetical protein BDW22DRAFT_1353621 [Trametopsis cervina]